MDSVSRALGDRSSHFPSTRRCGAGQRTCTHLQTEQPLHTNTQRQDVCKLPVPSGKNEPSHVGSLSALPLDARPLPDVAMTGKCTRECDEYGHSDSCWMPVRTSPERRPSKSTTTPQQPKLSTFMSGGGSSGGVEHPGSQETLAVAAVANGDPAAAHMMGDRNRNLLSKKMASSSSSYEAFGSPSYSSPGSGEEVLGHPTEEIPLAPTGEYKPTSCGTLTRREVYL